MNGFCLKKGQALKASAGTPPPKLSLSAPPPDNMHRHMRNKCVNPAFGPMYSVMNASENFQQFSFVHPFTCVIAGMIGLRNAVWVKSLLHQAEEIIHVLPKGIVRCYSQSQPAYMESMVTAPNMEFVKGFLSDLEHDSFSGLKNATFL